MGFGKQNEITHTKVNIRHIKITSLTVCLHLRNYSDFINFKEIIQIMIVHFFSLNQHAKP